MPTDIPAPAADQQDMLDCLRRGRRAAGQDPAKRQQIIEGARRVFIEMGFDAASMNDITRAAGVSKGTIYVYFANKEELFEALIEDERHRIFNDLYDALERDAAGLREALIRYGMALATKITSDKVTKGELSIDNLELAAYQLTDLCLSGYYRQRLFGYRTDAPHPDEIRATVTSGVDVFLRAYSAKPLADAARPGQTETA